MNLAGFARWEPPGGSAAGRERTPWYGPFRHPPRVLSSSTRLRRAHQRAVPLHEPVPARSMRSFMSRLYGRTDQPVVATGSEPLLDE